MSWARASRLAVAGTFAAALVDRAPLGLRGLADFCGDLRAVRWPEPVAFDSEWLPTSVLKNSTGS